MVRIEHSITGSNGRPMGVNVHVDRMAEVRGVLIFCHGYKGFKDWGCWSLLGDRFASKGYAFVRFNFSHNGTTPEHPAQFTALEAFAENNYSIEVEDLRRIIDAVPDLVPKRYQRKPLTLLGHSRGGGIALLTGARDARVDRIMTFSSVSDFSLRFPVDDALEKWKSDGVFYAHNARTGQSLPHKIQWFEDFVENEEKLSIRNAIYGMQKPLLVVHAADDQAVHLSEALRLSRWCATAELRLIQEGGHTLGSKHPWAHTELPEAMQRVFDYCLIFLKS